MAEPLVCAVMLTRDRPELAAKAVECFRRQTYENKVLFFLDTGVCEVEIIQAYGVYGEYYPGLRTDRKSIGALRNLANGFAMPAVLNADIIVHFDDDDYSHSSRIAEQVALLQSSGADCVGYREMLFWQCDFDPESGERGCQYEAAWLYRHSHPNYALGTSLCYWRRVWENNQFRDTSQGEDLHFMQRVRGLGVGSLEPEPRMIARIHGGNTSNAYNPVSMAKDEWRRAPEFDAYCREVME